MNLKKLGIEGLIALMGYGAFGAPDAHAGDWNTTAAYAAVQEGGDTKGVLRTLGRVTPVDVDGNKLNIDYFGELAGTTDDPTDADGFYIQFRPGVSLCEGLNLGSMIEMHGGDDTIRAGGTYESPIGDHVFAQGRLYPVKEGSEQELRADLFTAVNGELVGVPLTLENLAVFKNDYDGNSTIFDELIIKAQLGEQTYLGLGGTYFDDFEGNNDITGIIMFGYNPQ